MTVIIHHGDCRKILRTMPDLSVHCCVTSPPYFGLRDYGTTGQIGLEPTPDAYVAELVAVFAEVRRVLRDDGTLWLNLGDSYSSGGRTTQVAPTLRGNGKDEASGKQAYLNNFAVRPGNVVGLKPKDLIGIPWRVAFALQADGWYLRQDIIWSKPNPMPESVTDRCTKAHEYIFLMSKQARYFYDAAAIAEPTVDPDREVQKTYGRPLKEAYAQGPMARGANGLNHQFADPDRNWGQQGTRNKRSVWEVASQPFAEAHFATFPPDLIEPCIKAGTSEKGCCAKCGAPWQRVVERNVDWPQRRGGKGNNNDRADGGMACNADREIRTLGWSASCTCNAAVIPCTVLDPFAGAGTTGLVADRLGRNALLIELNPGYTAMIEARIRGDAGMFAEVSISEVTP